MNLKTTSISDDKYDGFIEPFEAGSFAQIDKFISYRYSRDNTIFSCPEEEIVLFDHNTCPFYFSLLLASGGTIIEIERGYVSILTALSDI